jgi:hypothetical protein
MAGGRLTEFSLAAIAAAPPPRAPGRAQARPTGCRRARSRSQRSRHRGSTPRESSAQMLLAIVGQLGHGSSAEGHGSPK